MAAVTMTYNGNPVTVNCGGRGGKKGPCKKSGGAGPVHRFESDDKDGGKSRLVVKKTGTAWTSHHYSQAAGEQGFTHQESFHLGSHKSMTEGDALKKAKKNFGKIDRTL